MGTARASVETLKKAVFERVEICRRGLRQGTANLTGLEDGVRAYCEAVAGLAGEERRDHAEQLASLMREIEALGAELALARDIVKDEIAGLSRVKQANLAYHKSDAMGAVYRPKSEDE